MELKEIRLSKELTQSQAANILNISLRSYKSYENEITKRNTRKYIHYINSLNKECLLDEEHGLLTIEKITQIVAKVFENKDINFCYLFGSYAKGKQKPTSDVDLLIDSSIHGGAIFELVEELREALHKKVDYLDLSQLENNTDLLREIMKDGIKIFG